MHTIQLLLQTIRDESTLASFQIESKIDNRLKETIFFFCLWYKWLLPFSPYAFFILEKKNNHTQAENLFEYIKISLKLANKCL